MNDVAQLGDIWRIHYWKNPDNHDAGIKTYTYLLLAEYTCPPENISEYDEAAYEAIEIETGIDNSLIYTSDLYMQTRTHHFQEYIVFAEKLA